MKKSLKWILILIAFVAAIVAVYFAYRALSEKYAPDRITQIGGNNKPQTEDSNNNITPDKNETDQPDNDTDKAENNTNQAENDSEEESTVGSINLAPDFTVLDKDGNKVKLSDYFC